MNAQFYKVIYKSINLAIILIILLTHQVRAYEVKKMTMTEKIAESDLVFIGTVLSIETVVLPNHVSARFANIKIASLIKGKRENSVIRFALSNGISELDPNCCEINKSYIIFSKMGKYGIYLSSNGPYGAFLIRAKAPDARF